LGLISAIASPSATAQITPDTTLGNESSRVTRNVVVRGGNGDRVDGGAARGANLFHSFSEFNVNEGQRVYFANPVGVTDILSRVTGNTRSDIMGTLGVDGSANLFLLNPNGIMFGPDARLDVGGSFTASTANSFTFPDGSEFSATNPGDPSLLSVAVPLGVQYGAIPPGAITNAGNLAVEQNLRVSGGSVTSTGGIRMAIHLEEW
jgi:filamentous hemagglutinin family protein